MVRKMQSVQKNGQELPRGSQGPGRAFEAFSGWKRTLPFGIHPEKAQILQWQFQNRIIQNDGHRTFFRRDNR